VAKLTKTLRKKAVKMYEKGAGIGTVAELLGVSSGAARKVLVEEGVEIRSRGRPKRS